MPRTLPIADRYRPFRGLSRHLLRHLGLLPVALLAACGQLVTAVDAPTGGTATGGTATGGTPAEPDPQLTAHLAEARPIAAGQSPWLEELTWMEVRDAIASGTTTVIIPTGGIEENGPFLATGKHNLILEASCPAIAAKLGNALCAPIVKFVPEGNISPPTGAMRFPGSISLSASTYQALLDDIASSLKQAGFSNIVLIGDSGGNQRGMAAVADSLNGRWADDTAVVHFIKAFYSPGWEATEQYTAQELGVAESQKDGHHDDIWVTAMMMVTDPTQVRYEQRLDADLASINGVSIADLEQTVELGRKMVEFRAELTAAAIRDAINTAANTNR